VPDSPSPDRVTAKLAAIREDFRVTADLERLGGYKTHTAALRHGTALLAAVEAVLATHRRSIFPATTGKDRGKHYCLACTASVDDQSLYAIWPCPTYAAISSALLGEAPDAT